MAKKKPETRQPTLDDLISSGYRYTSIEEPPAEPEAQPEKSSFARRALGDTGVALLKGAIGVPEAAVGMADLVSGGEAGRLAEQAGFRPKEAKAILDTYLSPEQQAANQKVQEADGFMAKMGAAVTNPSVIWQGAVESAPSMLGGAAVARGVMAAAPRVAPVVAAGIGEGAVSAGQSAEQIRQETADGTLTGKQAAIAATSGALTGALGVVAGRVAQKLGIGDVDTMLAGLKSASPKMQKGVVRSVLEGAVSEGVLEELPQSVQEQVAQNMALGKPLDEGVDHAAVIGMLAGGLMGGVAGPLATGTPEGKAIRDEKMPEVGPLTKALNAATEARAQQVDAGMPTVTADQATVEAQARMADLEKKAKGTKDETHPGPDGKPVTIPGTPAQYLTDAERQERDFLAQNADNPEALARAQGATVSPLMRQPDAAIPGAVPPDTALARMEDMAKRMDQADRFASRGDAAAPAPAPEPAPAVAGDDANPPPEPGDILNPKGEPFKNKMAVGKARKAQANPDDFVIASVAGGYVLRPVKKEPTDGSVAVPAGRGLAGGSGVWAADGGGSLASDGRPADAPAGRLPAGTAAADSAAADAGLATGGNDAPVAADVAGEPIDAEWTAFKPETGTKAVPRAEMPQIKAEHRGAMTQFLKGRGITHEQEQDVDPTSLKPTQAEFAPGKVQRARDFTEGDRAILVSSDGHILDGHHQWLAAREDSKPIRVIRFDAPIEQLMAQAKEFPSSTTAEGATEPTTALTETQRLFVDGPDGKKYPVRDVREAQELWERFVAEAGEGVSKLGNGVRIVDQNGKFVARVSYNGRAWDTEDDGKGGGRVIAESPATQRAAWERSVAEPLGLQLGGAGWNLPVGNLGEVVVSFTSQPGEPLRAEVSAEYLGKSFDKRAAEGEPAIKEAIERARAGIQEGRDRMARGKVEGDKPAAALPAAEDSPQARWTRSTDAERLGVLGKAGWSVTPPSQSTQRMLKLAWDKMSEEQRSRIATAMESFAPSDPPAEPNAEKNDAPGSNSTEAKNREKAPSARVDGTRQEDLAGAAAATAAQSDGVTQSKSPAFDDEVGALDDIEEAPEGFASLPDSATESAPAREQQTVVIELRKRLSVLEQLKGCLAS